MRKSLAIIPARGGSKRIPRKNIKDFLGKPIIAYSIEAALQSGLFSEVMVSTDDEEIATIAQTLGASVPFMRSADNANDFASTTQAIDEVLDAYKERNVNFDFACCIYPTAPLIQVEHLKEGFALLKQKNLDSVFPVVEFSYPIWRSLKREENTTAMIWPEHKLSRSQDLPKAFHDAGQWYWMNLEKYNGELWTANTDSIFLHPNEVQDIDTMDDWELAEIKYERLQSTD